MIALIIAAKFVWPRISGHDLLFHLWAHAASAREWHALRLAAGRRHGPRLLHRSAALRRQALEREAGRGHFNSVERHHPQCRRSRCLADIRQGLEYADLPTPVAMLVVIAWIMFGVNIFGTIATRKYQQMYVSIWYLMGTILWTAFVYLTGNFARAAGITGVNQANLNWMYTHNAVGLIFTPAGLAVAYYFIPRTSNTPLYSHKLSMIGFWSLAFVYVWTGAHHMLHGPSRSGCRPSPSSSQ